jgi:hypothetical protein
MSASTNKKTVFAGKSREELINMIIRLQTRVDSLSIEKLELLRDIEDLRIKIDRLRPYIVTGEPLGNYY